jgi:Glycosyl hydrolase family 47
MLTLIDSLDSLLVFREFDLFFDALHKLKSLSFHRNIEVSVFEVNIRVLGGLLSSHQLANKLFSKNSNGENHGNQNGNYDEDYAGFVENDTNNDNNESEIRSDDIRNRNGIKKNLQNMKFGKIQKKNYTYDGNFLLNFAKDLGDRMLPAFHTLSGIPIQRINLLNGKNSTELSYTCTAAGSTFLLEMGLLSRLSGEETIRILFFILYLLLICNVSFCYFFVLCLFFNFLFG